MSIVDRSEEAVELTPIDLDALSIEELVKRQSEIEKKIQDKRQAEKREVIRQIVDVVKTYGITAAELTAALDILRVKGKAPIKYRNPETGATWSGRGKAPSWIEGKDRDLFLIKK